MENILDTIKDYPIPDQGIYKVTQYLFDLIHDRIPEIIQNIPAEVMIYAITGAYGVTRGLQYTSKNVVDKIIPGFHDKALPVLERICEFGIPAVVLVYALYDQEGFTYWAYSKQLDNLGILFAYLGGVIAAEQDLQGRSKSEF